jgi:chromosome segregation ATPase
MNKVSREKYELLKSKTQKWVERSVELEEKYNLLFEKNKIILQENEELFTNVSNFKKELRNSTNSSEIQEENKELKKDLRISKKKLSSFDDKTNRINFEIEKQLILKQGEVERLQASIDDIKERYNDIKEENKELRISLREIESSKIYKNM